MLHIIKGFGAINLFDVSVVVACARPIVDQDGSVVTRTREIAKSPTLLVYLRDREYPFYVPCASQEEAQSEGDRLIEARNAAVAKSARRMIVLPDGNGILASQIRQVEFIPAIWVRQENVALAAQPAFSVPRVLVHAIGGAEPLEFRFDGAGEAQNWRDNLIDEVNGEA